MIDDGDQRDRLDRRRHVAERVELLVGGHEVGGLTDDRQADRRASCAMHLVGRQVDAEAGDRLELVERAAGVAEPAPDIIWPTGTPQAATIGATASDVLSPTPPVECLSTTVRPSRAEVEHLARADHRVGERERLAPASCRGSRRPSPGGHLVVGHVAARVAEDELGKLVRGELLAVALPLDQLGRAAHMFLGHLVITSHRNDHAR